jgi:phosphopantetheine adenylyltransferase
MPTTNPAVEALHDCHRLLLQATLAAADTVSSLTGARLARAAELIDQIDAAVSHCNRLATIIEGDHRAEVAR